jgi:hypothetical protein
VFYADPEFPTLHWLAQFVPNGEEPRGILRLVSDSGQLGTANVGIRSDDSVDLRTLDPKRVHVVGGAANFASSGGARFIGLGLYGAAGGFLVRWLAVSQTR